MCVVLLLSACGSLRGPESVAGPMAADATNRSAAHTEPAADDLDNDAYVATPTGEIDTLLTVDALPAKPDLLQRMRAGFRLPEVDSKHHQQYLRWSLEHPSYLKNLFDRGAPYLHYIVEQVERRGMPLEIALLPAVESAFKPNAVSRSRAAGIWQFMPATGRHFGLRQDWWYDGRRDIVSSTNAALDYLTLLHERFNGDWFLALAAYNAGQGNLAKAIKRNKRAGKATDYQSLRLRQETRRYVPKLLALRDIVADPQRYQIELPEISDVPHFEVVQLQGQVDIQKIAADAGLDVDEVRHLNAGFLRWATSPQGPHRLLIPLSHVEQFRDQSAATGTVTYQHHPVAPGDTLSQIARRYGVSVGAIKSTNNMRNSRIRAGKSLLIPVAAANSGADTAVAIESNSNNSSLPTNSSAKLIHRVRSGDTLWSIARQYQVKVQQLLSWNSLKINQVLSLDQPVTVFTAR